MPSSDWLSAHLFFPGELYGDEFDRAAREVVEPLVRRLAASGWTDRWFFIRYGQGGAHLRLRLHGAPEVLEERVRPALLQHLSGAPGGPSRVEWVPYLPETARYGGPEAVALAEHLFHRSSEAALALLARTRPGDRSARLGKGLIATAVLIHTFLPGRSEAAAFAHRYGTLYLRALARDEEQREQWLDAFGSGWEQQSETLAEYVEEVWGRMDEGESLSGTLDGYAADLAGVRDRLRALCGAGVLHGHSGPLSTWEEAVTAIVPSYAHMTNNRLGVRTPEESYLAYLIARALGGAGAPAEGAA